MVDREAGQDVDLNEDAERYATIASTFMELPPGTSLMLYKRISDEQLVVCATMIHEDDSVWELMLRGASSMAETVKSYQKDDTEVGDEDEGEPAT